MSHRSNDVRLNVETLDGRLAPSTMQWGTYQFDFFNYVSSSVYSPTYSPTPTEGVRIHDSACYDPWCEGV